MASAKAQLLTSPALVRWSDNQLFDGFVLLALSLPSGHGSASVKIEQGSAFRIPLWIPVPIRQGVIDAQSRVWFNSSIEPTGTRYAAHWYSANKVLIALGGSVFVVSTDPHTLAVPQLPAPTTASGVPAPESSPGVITQILVGVPTEEALTGTIDGVNAVFTISVNAQFVLIKRNGVILTAGVGYVRSGVTITFQAGYIPQSGDEIRAILWA